MTRRDEMGDRGPHVHRVGEDLVGRGVGGLGWTLETCSEQRRLGDAVTAPLHGAAKQLPAYLRPHGIPVTCSHESSTGGGAVVVTVVVLMSPMMFRPSRRAWYIRSISSRRWAWRGSRSLTRLKGRAGRGPTLWRDIATCSWDSSIRVFWSPQE